MASSDRRPVRRILTQTAAIVFAAIPLAAPGPATAAPPATPRESDEAAPPPKDLVVRGSVEQIHVLHAPPASEVVVRGPDGFRAAAVTDRLGGLVLRNVPPGAGYHVAVGGTPVPEVRVLGREDHPDPSFYAAQKLAPSGGYLETRDGTLLSYRVVLPDPAMHGPGPYGLVITYSGYQPGLKTADRHQNIPFERFSEAGYAVAGVNMRGSGCSGGAFDLMEPLTWLDGYDAVEAFAAQDWVDGVALGDQSWPGLTQLYVAATRPPSLKAVMAGSVVGDFYRDVFYPGGIQNVGFGHIWAAGRDVENAFPSRRKEIVAQVEADSLCAANQALRGQNVSLLETIRANPYDGDFWQGRSAEPLVGRIKAPVLQVVSWQDPQVGGRPAALYGHYSPGTPVRLVGVNGFHQYWSGAVRDEVREFVDVYLGGAGPDAVAEYEARNDVVVLLESDAAGEVRGRFTLPDFAAGDGRRFQLGPALVPDDATGSGGSSTFTYAPNPPGSWTKPVQDQATFTSEALDHDTAMAGPGSADLWIAAEAEDVDLQVTLSEVRPDGQEMLVQSGWLRASHRALDEAGSTPLRPRHPHTKESVEKLTPGEPTPVRIELFPFAHVFRAGSRLRVTVSGPGGGGNAWPWAFDALPGEFPVRILHDADANPSSVVLPVVVPTDLNLPPSLPAPDAVWLQPCRPVQ